MNIRNATYALIAALIFDIIFKVIYFIDPSILSGTFISSITKIISFAVGIIVILFLYYFYNRSRSHKNLAVLIKVLIVVFVLQYLARLSAFQNFFHHSNLMFFRSVLNVIRAIILFATLVIFIKSLPEEPIKLKQSAVVLSILFGVGIAKNLYMLILYIKYLESGYMLQVNPAFQLAFFVLFLLFHVCVLWFLFTYLHNEDLNSKEKTR